MENPSRREFLESLPLFTSMGLGAGLLIRVGGVPCGPLNSPQIEPGYEPGYLGLHRSGEL